MVKIATSQRVLDKSMELFNRFGIDAVSVNQIAEALAISPGNLTYHYKRKPNLLSAHIDQFEQTLKAQLEGFPVKSDARTFARAWVDLVALTYSYRFLFVGANYIVQNDLVSMARYAKLIERTKRWFERQIQRLVTDGYMLPVRPPYSVAMLVDSIWWQWMGWLLVMQVTPPPKRATEKRVLADAVTHILFLNYQFVDRVYFKDVLSELKRIT